MKINQFEDLKIIHFQIVPPSYFQINSLSNSQITPHFQIVTLSNFQIAKPFDSLRDHLASTFSNRHIIKFSNFQISTFSNQPSFSNRQNILYSNYPSFSNRHIIKFSNYPSFSNRHIIKFSN